MKILKYSDKTFDQQINSLTTKSTLFDLNIENQVRKIINLVKLKGDKALLALGKKFDHVKLTLDTLKLTKAELLTAAISVDDPLRNAIADAKKNIELFCRKSIRKNWSTKNRHGAEIGEKFDPIERVGIYVPGGKAPLISTVLMTVTLAKTAGCKEIVVCTPCAKDGTINPSLLYAAVEAGATEVYRIGGAQAIAAMALGTESIRKVHKIFGPGNAYVVMAKRLLFGYVGIDLLPGPSEVLIIADDTANPEFIAADMLAQAEHGSGHEQIWMITTSQKLIQQVVKAITQLKSKSSRKDYITQVLDRQTAIILVSSIEQAIEITNQLAPEHCEIMTTDSSSISKELTKCGAIFLGPFTPTAVGDYVAGPSHVLPTGGAGAAFGGLSIDQFFRRTSVIQYSKESLKKAFTSLETLAMKEGLTSHADSVRIRLKN